MTFIDANHLNVKELRAGWKGRQDNARPELTEGGHRLARLFYLAFFLLIEHSELASRRSPFR